MAGCDAAIFDEPRDAFVAEADVMHRGKQADAAKAEIGDGAAHAVDRVRCGRIDHEEADKPRGMTADSDGNRLLVARHARNDRRSRHVLRIELRDPSVGQRFGRSGTIPLQLSAHVGSRLRWRSAALARKRGEELRREKMAVRVVDPGVERHSNSGSSGG